MTPMKRLFSTFFIQTREWIRICSNLNKVCTQNLSQPFLFVVSDDRSLKFWKITGLSLDTRYMMSILYVAVPVQRIEHSVHSQINTSNHPAWATVLMVHKLYSRAKPYQANPTLQVSMDHHVLITTAHFGVRFIKAFGTRLLWRVLGNKLQKCFVLLLCCNHATGSKFCAFLTFCNVIIHSPFHLRKTPLNVIPSSSGS